MTLVLKSKLNLICSTPKHVYMNYFMRCLATNHIPKFRKLRKAKLIVPELPDFDKLKNPNRESKEEQRAKRIKEGFEPPVSFEYKPISFTTSGEIFDPYVPPEGDGKASLFSKSFASNALESLKKKGTVFRHSKVIKKYDQSFTEDSFAEFAQELYIESHKALANRDEEKLQEYVTEHAYGKMWTKMKFKTIKWKLVETLEPPVVKHMVTRELLSKKDLFGQVTVRLHTKQILAIYDRFGRLSYGSESLSKDVLEYVVFERYLTNPYSSWRLHDKIEPTWAPSKPPVLRSFVQPKPYYIDDSVEDQPKSKFKSTDSHIEEESSIEKLNKPAPNVN